MKLRAPHTDWTKHELIITDTPELKIWKLKHPDYDIFLSVSFINTNGIMAVTGDYGNWIFCREFHPSAEGSVSDGYWLEKLRIASNQEGIVFDHEETEAQIQILLDTEEDLTEEEKEYLEDCKYHLQDGEWWYEKFCYSENCGRFEDTDYIPFVKNTHPWLKIIFDAFEEICKRYGTRST